jgi:DNA-binding MarR family transcriptional regulator
MTNTIGPLDRFRVSPGTDSVHRLGELAVGTSAAPRPSALTSPGMTNTRGLPPAAQVPGLEDVEQQCWQQFIDSSSRIFDTLHRTLMTEHNLGLYDVLLLGILAKSDDGSARMGDLAEALVLIPSRVTQQTHRLEAQGLLRRTASKDDRRGVSATITRAGRARLRPALTTYARIVRAQFLDPLSRQQMSAVGDSCRRISTGMKRLK